MPQSLPLPTHMTLRLPTAEATSRLAERLAPLLAPGDTLLLDGPIGAGKTHFARALIQTRLGRAEDVPSPTFTLVQTYDGGGVEIWHTDLYRLSHPDEVWELGLHDAFSTAICIVEWPDRLGRHLPQDALRISLSSEGEGRLATFSGGRKGLIAALRNAIDA